VYISAHVRVSDTENLTGSFANEAVAMPKTSSRRPIWSSYVSDDDEIEGLGCVGVVGGHHTEGCQRLNPSVEDFEL
jgi:hypothetical protein